MAKVKNEGQRTFEDVPLQVANHEELLDHLNTVVETKEAASNYNVAKRKIKDFLPDVEKPTRFFVEPGFFIEVTPYTAEGFQVEGGTRRRIRVVESNSD